MNANPVSFHLDLESFSVYDNAKMASVGIAVIDEVTFELIDHFYSEINDTTSGSQVDSDIWDFVGTISNDDTRAVFHRTFLLTDKSHLDVIQKLSEFFKKYEDRLQAIYARGPEYDMIVLQNYLRRVYDLGNYKHSYHKDVLEFYMLLKTKLFRKFQSHRTIESLAKKMKIKDVRMDFQTAGNLHHALYDSVREASIYAFVMKELMSGNQKADNLTEKLFREIDEQTSEYLKGI